MLVTFCRLCKDSFILTKGELALELVKFLSEMLSKFKKKAVQPKWNLRFIERLSPLKIKIKKPNIL